MDKKVKFLKEELKEREVQIQKEQLYKIQYLSERKYNYYDQYLPGETFQNRLLRWLENFDKKDRNIAMKVVKHLTYIDMHELRSLAVTTFWNSLLLIEKEIIKNIDREIFLKTYQKKKKKLIDKELGKSIYVAIADDVLFDYFRRRAQRRKPTILGGDSFVEYYKLHPYCQEDDLDKLEDTERIFMLDQLSASGTSFIRKEENGWKGKIIRFKEIWKNIENVKIYYLPYIMSSVAERNVNRRLKKWRCEENPSLKDIVIKPSLKVKVSKCVRANNSYKIDETKPVAKLCEKYFDEDIIDEHKEKGGECKWGFGESGLDLVLNTNCPNNTLPIIWHDYNEWIPLFPRIEHHIPQEE